MGYTDGASCGDKVGDMVRFLRERQRGNKGEERGPLDEVGVRGVVSPKEERKEREGGGPIRGTRRES